MASKPRNISSSPTNLSPSRVAIRSSCAPAVAPPVAVTPPTGRPATVVNGSKKGTSSPGSAGRTPQTRRKELALSQQNSPGSSPKQQSTYKKNSNGGPVRKISGTSGTKNATTNGSNSRRPRGRGLSANKVDPPPPLQVKLLREETKFDGLWDVKTIENGLVRIPTQCLEELISEESIEKFYEVEDKPVASGLFATVRKCVHRETGITYAAKFSSRVRCGVDCSMEILHEIAMLSVCTDSNKIVHLKDVFQNKHEIILVLEYAPGGDFQSVLDEDMVPFEEDVQGFLRQILEALDFIHERNIAHLDIKPQNIVLMGQFPNCEIKLCDLEVARVIKEDEDIREIIGTPDYVAPEILAMEPITLAADIWSLGVVAYVLLTGFSPFGGDTDQETLRNISTATLDFPPELFEGVSDMAKEFISLCLVRDPKNRLCVKKCMAHPWLAPDDEPPSPSPLMLKIPTPDLIEPVPKSSLSPHGHGPGGFGSFGAISSRRSCQTCRDKITERKRYLSKSREAIFEKVAQSNLKKSLSKSRERLCDMRLTLSKSRDNLGTESMKVMSRPQDKLYGFKNLSKSQEVISEALGGVPMKRMINGAVSDISHALIKQPPPGSELPSPSMDFVYVPGSGLLVPQIDLLKIATSTGSLQVQLDNSGRSTPAITIQENNPVSQAEVVTTTTPPNIVLVTSPQTGSANLVESPLIEVSEEEDMEDLKLLRASSVPKDIKESQNYEMQKKQQALEDSNKMTMTTSVGVQVNLPVAAKVDPNLARKLAHLAQEPEEMDLERHLIRNNKSNYESKTLPRRRNSSNTDHTKMEAKPPLRRGFTHDQMLGLDAKSNPAWREELNKIRSQRPIKISELIGNFEVTTSEATAASEAAELAALKAKRRGSLQINLDPMALNGLAEDMEAKRRSSELAMLKLQRRKSTPSMLTSTIESLKIQDDHDEEKKDIEPEVSRMLKTRQVLTPTTKNWDYFEIDHPKAISDKKLQQLKTKYLRRRTESNLGGQIQEENEADLISPAVEEKPMLADRSKSVPDCLKAMGSSKALTLSIDPLTGVFMDESVTSEAVRKISTDSGEESADSSRRSSIIHRRRSSQMKAKNLNTMAEDEASVVEVRIDPLTGKVEVSQNCEKRRRLSVEISANCHDDGFISLPHTPTDLGGLDPRLKVATSSISSTGSTNSASTSHLADDGIFTSSEETLMKKATSLEDNSSRPASAASNFSKALERFNNAQPQNQPASEVSVAQRRQSSPMIRPSSS